MNVYQQPAHRPQQRSLPPTASNNELNKRQLPAPATALPHPAPPPNRLDPDRVLPPLATSSDGSKFVPFWKRNHQHQHQHQHPPGTVHNSSAAAASTLPQRAIQHQSQHQQPQPPKKKWLTQAEMGMVGPAIIPFPIPTARTSTTSTTTTTSNTSTTTNNNIGTTVSSSGSGLTASSVTGRTFNYNYNNYNHHVHQFNQPPPVPVPGSSTSSSRQQQQQQQQPPLSSTNHPAVGPAINGGGGGGYGDPTRKVMGWHGRGAAVYHRHVVQNGEDEEDDATPTSEEEEEEEQDGTEEEEEESPSSPQYGILDLPASRGGQHRRAQSYPNTNTVSSRDYLKQKTKKVVHLDSGLPTPPAVLVLQTPHHKKGEYTPAYAYEYSLKYDQDQDGRYAHGERKKGRRGSEDEEDSDDSDDEEEEDSPPPKKKKSKIKNGERKSAKAKTSSKTKSKVKGKPKAKKKPSSNRKSRDEEDDSEEEDSEDDSEDEESESEEDEDHPVRKKPKKRAAQSPKPKKKTQESSMSLKFASMGINDNPYPQHRATRSEDYARHSPSSAFSASSRNTPPTTGSTRWPADLPRLPRTPGTPADGMPSMGTTPGSSPTKGYFDYQPNQQQQSYPQHSARPGGYTPTTTTRPLSISPASGSYTSSGLGGQRDKERNYMNLDDPPPVSLRRSPSPSYSSSSHSHTRSLPHIVGSATSSYPPSSSSSPSKAYEQIRSRVEQQPQVSSNPIQNQVQARPQQPPQEPVRRYSQPPISSSAFHSSHAFWQQQQQQQSPYSRPPSTGSSYGNVNGYQNVQPPASSAPAPAQAPAALTRRRELPPQPTQGRERAQEILKEAIERQALRYNPPSTHAPQPQQQPQPQPQWRPPPQPAPATTSTATFPPRVQQGVQQPPRHHPLPQPSIPQQQYAGRQLPQHPQPVPPPQQYRQPIIQQSQQSQPQPQPQQQPSHSFRPLTQPSQHPLPQPPVRQGQQHGQQPQPQPTQTQRQQKQQPPQAQRNVYRPSSMPVESPLPVGGRDKVADIPRMGKAASVVSSEGGYGSGGSVSPSDSDIERSRASPQGTSASGSSVGTGPKIVVDSSGSKGSPSVSGSPMPVIQIQEEEESGDVSVPQVQVFEVPGINFSGPDDGDSGGPSISISGPDDEEPQRRPRSQPVPQVPSPQQRVKSAPALADSVILRRNQGGLSCGGCQGSIVGRTVNAMGMRWHPECFRCSVCDTLLEHVSSYEHEGKPYCHLDYHENFAPRCYHCKTAIIEERFISLDDPALGKRTYHEPHFFCAECGDPFLTPSTSDFEGEGGEKRSGELALSGDGEFESDNVGFTVYRGHPYCESCHVRLRFPKCKRCRRSIRDGDRAVEALGGKWCWACFVCESCQQPFEDPAFFQRGEKPYCEPCFSVMLRNEV